MNYTNEQLQAIETIEDNLQIIACAGSGKTGVVTERIINILKKKPEIKPKNIVAFTFTEKAAGELKDRIYRKIQTNFGENYLGIAEMYIGTIHGFCLKLLQDHYAEFNKFQVLNEVRTKLFVDKHAYSLGIQNLESTTGKKMRPYQDTDLFLSMIGILRESETNGNILPQNLKDILEKYNELFEQNCYFDFTMIMEKAIYHLENDAQLRERTKERIQYLTVDEYQDVNPIQEKLIRILYDLGANICVVGDDDQTIYQWRGSEIKNILTFNERYKVDKSMYLVDNFRSSNGIVDVAKRVIKNNLERMPKEMKYKSEFKFAEADLVYKEFQTPEEEYEFIAARILELKEAGLNYTDMAILMRIKKIGAPLIEILAKYNIPFIIEDVNDLFTTQEIKACVGIYNFLHKDIDEKKLFELWKDIRHISLPEINIQSAINDLKSINIDKKIYYSKFNLQQIFYDFIDTIELKEQEEEQNEAVEILLYNIGKFTQVIDDFESIHYTSNPETKLTKFCNFLEYTASGYYPEGHLQNVYLRPDGVRIMTIHKSKGLEFPAVFIPTLTKNYFPQKKHGGLSVWHFLDKDLIKNAERYNSGNMEDERRLFYVAVTRAKKFLFLTRAVYSSQAKEISQFLTEAKMSSCIFEYDDRMNYAKRKDIINLKPESQEIVLNFSVLSDFYHCPYRYKLTYFYGFAQPLIPFMGYGHSLHNIVMKIHKTFEYNGSVGKYELADMIENNFHLPYADKTIKEKMKKNAIDAIHTYYDENHSEFSNIVFSEKEIEIDIGDKIRVNGRMDLVKRKDTDAERVFIVDFKTADRESYLNISPEQLKIYALGYQKLTGQNADYIEFYNLDTNERDSKRLSNEDLLKTEATIVDAANKIRKDTLQKKCSTEKCSNCYMSQICLTTRQKNKVEVAH